MDEEGDGGEFEDVDGRDVDEDSPEGILGAIGRVSNRTKDARGTAALPFGPLTESTPSSGVIVTDEGKGIGRDPTWDAERELVAKPLHSTRCMLSKVGSKRAQRVGQTPVLFPLLLNFASQKSKSQPPKLDPWVNRVLSCYSG